MAARAEEALQAAPEGSYLGGVLWYQVSIFLVFLFGTYFHPHHVFIRRGVVNVRFCGNVCWAAFVFADA